MPLASIVANWLAGWGPDEGQVTLTATATLIAAGHAVTHQQPGGGWRTLPIPTRPHRVVHAKVRLDAYATLHTTGHALSLFLADEAELVLAGVI